jgi:hypothetical protein
MADATPPLPEADRADLVAFLGGELSGEAATSMATRLTREPALRREADRLGASWALLDHLPQPDASAALTTKTLTRIQSLEAPLGTQPQPSAVGRGRVPAWLAATALASAVGLTGWAGYTLAGWLWPPIDRRLIQDLSLAENLEEYEAVGSWSFAERLAALPEPEP